MFLKNTSCNIDTQYNTTAVPITPPKSAPV